MSEIEPAMSPPAAVPQWARSFAARWHVVECWIAVAAFTFIAVILLLDVIGRELLGPLVRLFGMRVATGIFASQKMSVYALVIGAFVGIGIATATGSHLVPRVGFGWVPKAWSPWMDRLADLITGCFLLGVAYSGAKFVESSYSVDLRAPVLDWSVWPFQLAIPLGFVSAACRYFVYTLWPSLRPGLPEFQE